MYKNKIKIISDQCLKFIWLIKNTEDLSPTAPFGRILDLQSSVSNENFQVITKCFTDKVFFFLLFFSLETIISVDCNNFLQFGRTHILIALLTSCSPSAFNSDHILWYLQGDIHLQQNERFNMFEKTGIQYLEIQNVQLADAGIYTCTVVNSAGKASVSAELTVQGTVKTD